MLKRKVGNYSLNLVLFLNIRLSHIHLKCLNSFLPDEMAIVTDDALLVHLATIWMEISALDEDSFWVISLLEEAKVD